MIHLFFCFWLFVCGQNLKNVSSALCLFVWCPPRAARESSHTVCMVPEQDWSRLVNWTPPAGELDETAGKATGRWSPKNVVRMKWKSQAEDPNSQIIGQCSKSSFLYQLFTFTRIQEGSWACTSTLHVFYELGEGLRLYSVICPSGCCSIQTSSWSVKWSTQQGLHIWPENASWSPRESQRKWLGLWLWSGPREGMDRWAESFHQVLVCQTVRLTAPGDVVDIHVSCISSVCLATMANNTENSWERNEVILYYNQSLIFFLYRCSP